MKICIDARLYGPAKNKGLGRYVEQLVKNLEKVDSENEYVVLLRRENWDEYEPGEFTGSLHSLGATGVGRDDSGGNFKKVLVDYKWYSWEEQILLPFKLWRLKPDLVHFPHFNVPLFYFGKFVVTIHDLIMYKFTDERATTRSKFLYKIKYWLHKVIVKSAVKRAERVITVSAWTKKDIVCEFGVDEGKIVVTHEGYEVGSENMKLREYENNERDILEKYEIDRPYLLYVGNAYPHKNLERLVQAFEIIREKYNKDLQLILVGKNDYFYEKLKKEISPCGEISLYTGSAITDSVVNHLDNSITPREDLSRGKKVDNQKATLVDRTGLEPVFPQVVNHGACQLAERPRKGLLSNNYNIIFTDYVSNGELAELYKNALLYVFPSLYEGFGLPGLEAMNYRVPVVSSKASCLPEIYGEAAVYFEPTDVEDIVKKIIQVLEDETLREELVGKGLEQIEKYSWERCVERTLETYTHLRRG